LDNLTHSLFGLTLAQTPLRQAGPGTTPALVLASNAPDIDIVAALTNGGLEYLVLHRGPTHGPLGILALGLATAGIVRLVSTRSRFWPLVGVSILGLLMHVLMDLPTSYGTMLLSPMTWTWHAFDWLPIIDVYLWTLLVGGLVMILRVPAARERIAWTMLLLMVGNYGLRAGAHHAAVNTSWPERETGSVTCRDTGLVTWRGPRPPTRGSVGPCDRRQAALPSFLSPFQWRLIRQTADGYEMKNIDVLRRTMGPAVAIPDQDDAAIRTARRTRTAQVFLADFARFPAARSRARPDGSVEVRWDEVRFMGTVSGLPDGPDDDPPGTGLFVVRVTLDGQGRVVDERLGR
jgi:membrane-bound metal-dependent hydrolase YbcI (DUF457 family)